MTRLQEQYSYRDDLTAAVLRDLHGPTRDQEPTEEELVLHEPPVQRYITGILFPQSRDHLDPVHDIDTPDDDDDVAPDPPVSLANMRTPSSMALTFAVDPSASDTVNVTVYAARYEPRGDSGTRFTDLEWCRVPVASGFAHHIDVRNTTLDERIEIEVGLELFYRVRPAAADGNVAVTVGLINQLEMPESARYRDEFCYFQPRIDVEAGGLPAFVDRSSPDTAIDDVDVRSYRLLYRHVGNFAVGHGCAADWRQTQNDPPRAVKVWTTFTPTHDLLLADTNPSIVSDWMGMRRLSRAQRHEAVDGLTTFVTGYERWIESIADDAATLDGDLVDTASAHVQECRAAASRVRYGIDLLRTDDYAWTAFQLMNQAMQLQRARTTWIQGDNVELDEESTDHEWRPFQLGFILLSIGGIVDRSAPEREVVDLLWFPTGGGKTEAYLGLIAFTIFLRRLRGEADNTPSAGVTVIMRYTLRLLTLQQFERATGLICACEVIRHGRTDLGNAEISICLWVGSDATPNDHVDTRKALKELARTGERETTNPVQLHRCPWCGTLLSHANYWLTEHNPRLVIACKNTSCAFERGLPAFLVDQDIYSHRPTLMIATVDKFASLPWRDNVGSLFNLEHSEPPPDLIVHDELHLISGPLGTLVGLYETAIEMLCEDGDGIRPKIIASTATIRRSDEQVRGLYGASRAQFPPPGIDARDSYFAVEVPADRKASRRYVGLMAPATSHTTLLVRTYAALLEYASELDADTAVRDPYWTLVGYFNSLRVLGGALLQVRDDVPERMELLWNRTRMGEGPRFDAPELIELTSRESSARIPSHLERMSTDMDESDCLDVILATNMISVGVDVDRLGLMAVMGQPQSTSEYIQSTSRVGRRHPGLVTVLFNSGRSRDRSHYESFKTFHAALYRQVDATSVTPFSARARDRALHAVLIGMIRAKLPKYRANKSAANVDTLHTDAKPFIERIARRASAVMGEEEEATHRHLEDVVNRWIERAKEERRLVFSNFKQPRLGLLAPAGSAGRDETFEGFPTLWSLRDVDTTSNLYLVRGGS